MTTVLLSKALFSFGTPIIAMEEGDEFFKFILSDGRQVSLFNEKLSCLIEALKNLRSMMAHDCGE